MEVNRWESRVSNWDTHWRRDGKELFYISPERKVMAVDIKEYPSTFEVGTPKALFQTRLRATQRPGTITTFPPTASDSSSTISPKRRPRHPSASSSTGR